jgi:uncharacterized membrane protein
MRFDWRGPVALVLALGVVGVLIAGAVGSILNHDRTVTSDEIATIATVLGAAIGAVAVYLGGRPPTDPPGSLPTGDQPDREDPS